MQTDVWSWTNHIDRPAAAVSSSTGHAGRLDVRNLRDPRVGKLWRAGAAGQTALVADLVGPRDIGVIGLFGTNIADMDSASVKVGTTSGGGEVLNEAIDPEAWQNGFVCLIVKGMNPADPEADIRGSSVTITVDGPVPFRAGRLWVGPTNWQTEVGHSINSSRQAFDYSTRSLTPRSGAVLVDRASIRRSFTAVYDMLTREEYEIKLHEIDTRVGRSAQMLFIPSPDVYDVSRDPILGYLREQEETVFIGWERASRELSILECG